MIEYKYDFIIGEVENIKKLKIDSFNFYFFEENVDYMEDAEFQNFFNSIIEPVLEELDTNCIHIEVNDLSSIESVDVKKSALNKIIYFIMIDLPFNIIKPLLESNNINTLNELDKYLDENIEDLKNYITEELDNRVTVIKNTINVVRNDIERIKRSKTKYEKLNNNLSIVEKLAAGQIKYYEMFQNMVEGTPEDNFRNYIIKCVENGLLH